MTIAHEDADVLFGRGEFLKLINLAAIILARDPRASVRQRLNLAYAFALAGHIAAARDLARRFSHQENDPSIRSHAECVLALAAWRNGDVASAAKHFPSALRLATESRDAERVAWTYLHLLRFYIDFHPTNIVLGVLPSVRKAVTIVGSRHATAYLHCCVATLEGQMGRVDEAWRHCELSESLLVDEPNAWILGNSLLNRACISSLNCDFEKAETYIQAAKDAHSVSSNRRSLIVDGSLAYILLQTGQFARAESTLTTILNDSEISDIRKQPLLETSARLNLALNQLDECSLQLARLRSKGENEEDVPGYITRWAGITGARLLIRRGSFVEALDSLRLLENDNRQVLLRDLPFSAVLHLTNAHVFARMGQYRESARQILHAAQPDLARHCDLHGQYYYSCSSVLPDSDQLKRLLRSRALQLWATKGLLSARLEIEESPLDVEESRKELKAAKEVAPVIPTTIDCVTNSIAAAIDLAHNPRLIGRELVSIVKALGCASDVAVVETRNGTAIDDSEAAVLRLGESDGSNVFLRCSFPGDPRSAVLLADIFRIGRAAITLERVKRNERNHSALWPATPIKDQAGALFIDEEMQSVVATAQRVATANIPVLITGETGSGKEVIARLIHNCSPRASKAFLPFNCSATPRDMLDAQLFGHRKGAFTGATENFAGVIRAAAGGTLFLDEIGESTLDIQPKLLRFLESGEVHPIGETHPQRVDVRVLAATNADVDALVAQGRFREDLFYRLNIVRLHIPPLRERRIEIPSFAVHYLQRYAKESSKGDLRLSQETMEYLMLYRWPGNIRQLANEMRRLAALAEPGAVLMPEHLSPPIATSRRTVPVSNRVLDNSEIVVRIDQTIAAAVEHLERTMVHTVLAKASGVDEAAKMLGLSRKGLYLKRLRFGMEIDSPRGAREGTLGDQPD